MILVNELALGDYQTNCYIIRQEGSNRCAIIDPGYEAEYILHFLKSHQLTAEAILLTHGHFDHVGAVKSLAATIGCPVYVRPEEYTLPAFLNRGLHSTDDYPENGQLSVAGIDFLVLHTPGHTPGSVCLMAEGKLFTGDTLFAGSCGRIDFPGGSGADMQASLRRLRDLPGDFEVYPGHGGSTTLDRERRANPYLL